MSTQDAAPGPSDEARYIFLDNAIRRDDARHMLGTVIPQSFETRPQDNYRPNWIDPLLDPVIDGKVNPSRQQLEETMNKIWRTANTPVELHDVMMKRQLAVSNDVNASFMKLVDGAVKNDFNRDVEYTAGTVNFYSFDDPGANVPDLLLSCEPWTQQIEKLIHHNMQRHVYYIVTGVAVLQNVEVKWTEDEGKSRALGVKVPGEILNAVTQGVPPITGDVARAADVGLTWNRRAGEGSQVFARCTQEIILAVKYDEFLFDLEPAPSSTPGQGEVHGWEAANNSHQKKQSFIQRVMSIFNKSEKDTTDRPTLPSRRPPQAIRRIVNAGVGMPIRGRGFNSAMGSDNSSESGDADSDHNSTPIGLTGSDTLRPNPPRDVFAATRTPYIRAGDGAVVQGRV